MPDAAGAAWAQATERLPAQSTSGDELQTLFELGQGGMATAYLARAVGVGGFERLVVVKRLGPALLGNLEALRRFLAEARVAAHLRHVNVIGTHQVGWDAAGPFIVLDYVEGGSLDDLVWASAALGEQLPVGVVLRIARDTLAGLQAVHDAADARGRPLGILHRDISVQNVLIGVHDGVARLADFGVAKSTLGPGVTEPGFFVGKVLYFPPEYLLQEPIGPTLDIYALGVTIWLALTGEQLWPDETDGELVRAIIDQGVPSLEDRLELAPDIVAFVARACARDPQQRFQSAREMATVLDRFDRQIGWVASHEEVAECIERLLGADLRVRRERVARLAPALVRSGTVEAAAAARGGALPAVTERLLPAVTTRLPVLPSKAPERWHERHVVRGLIGAVVAAVLVTLAALLAFAPTPRPSATPTAQLLPPSPVPSPAAPSWTPLMPEARAAIASDAVPLALPPAVTPSRSSVEPAAAPPARRSAEPLRALPSTPAPPPRDLQRDGIERRNPYRETAGREAPLLR